jgi:hypothetical protein
LHHLRSPLYLRAAQGALIAQLDRASDYGSEGWGFESLSARQSHPLLPQPPHPASVGSEISAILQAGVPFAERASRCGVRYDLRT